MEKNPLPRAVFYGYLCRRRDWLASFQFQQVGFTAGGEEIRKLKFEDILRDPEK